MQIVVSSLAYWAGIAMLFNAAAFILWVEFYSLVKGAQISVLTPGWRGLVPSAFIVATILSAVTSAVSVIISVWF